MEIELPNHSRTFNETVAEVSVVFSITHPVFNEMIFASELLRSAETF